VIGTIADAGRPREFAMDQRKGPRIRKALKSRGIVWKPDSISTLGHAPHIHNHQVEELRWLTFLTGLGRIVLAGAAPELLWARLHRAGT